MVDNKLRILAAMKEIRGDRLTTVFPRQGHYALDPKNIAIYPPADLTVERIGDRVNYDLSALLDEKAIWQERYRSVVDLEAHLHRNGTRIIKFFLHQSKDEQRKRFLKRIDNPDKNWKLSIADSEERKLWKHYMQAYEACLSATSTKDAPWYVVPADDKKNSRLIISEIILDVFNGLKMAYPKPGAKRRRELQSIRKRLLK